MPFPNTFSYDYFELKELRFRKGSLTSPFLPISRAHISREKDALSLQEEEKILFTGDRELTLR